MPNSYFQFKQFTIYHDLCAMKVGTDGVLLGAWADCLSAHKVLDIGTGSGLIALLLAQRCHAEISGIDLDEGAFNQAQLNAIRSPFSNRIQIQHINFQDFASPYPYDLIVSNPPYFANSLQSPHKERSLARHNSQLSIETLFRKSITLLSNKGKIALVLPYEQLEKSDVEASKVGLYKNRQCNVKSLPHLPPKRVLLEYSTIQLPLEVKEFSIELSRHIYSEDYITLTKDFYLKM